VNTARSTQAQRFRGELPRSIGLQSPIWLPCCDGSDVLYTRLARYAIWPGRPQEKVASCTRALRSSMSHVRPVSTRGRPLL
jgi:hypothetical protein